jgi:hypothetical protein
MGASNSMDKGKSMDGSNCRANNRRNKIMVASSSMDFRKNMDASYSTANNRRNTCNSMHAIIAYIRGASEIKLKNVNKKRMATASQIFLKFLKASLADLITLLFSSLQSSEGGGNSGDSCAGPCQFLPFPKTKI